MLDERHHQVEQGGDGPCREDFLQLCLLPTYTKLFWELLPCEEMRMQVAQLLTSAWVGRSECCWVLPDPGILSVRSACLAQREVPESACPRLKLMGTHRAVSTKPWEVGPLSPEGASEEQGRKVHRELCR